MAYLVLASLFGGIGTFLKLEGKLPIYVLRLGCLAMVVWGAVQAVATVFNFADAAMGIMATINLVAILLLSGTVYKLTVDYFSQRRQNLEPRFVASKFPELSKGVDHTVWTEEIHAETQKH